MLDKHKLGRCLKLRRVQGQALQQRKPANHAADGDADSCDHDDPDPDGAEAEAEAEANDANAGDAADNGGGPGDPQDTEGGAAIRGEQSDDEDDETRAAEKATMQLFPGATTVEELFQYKQEFAHNLLEDHEDRELHEQNLGIARKAPAMGPGLRLWIRWGAPSNSGSMGQPCGRPMERKSGTP